jgi:hypothetical protein
MTKLHLTSDEFSAIDEKLDFIIKVFEEKFSETNVVLARHDMRFEKYRSQA